MKVWAKTDGAVKEGKFLVVRRDGTIPHWPHFVLGARDPCAQAALLAYANAAETQKFDPEFVESVRELAKDFEVYRTETGNGDPDAGPHRQDLLSVIQAMRHEPAVIFVKPDFKPKPKVKLALKVRNKPESTFPFESADPVFVKTTNKSSNVKEIGKDGAGHLYVRFLDESVYKWDNLAEQHYDLLVNADSPGRYIYREMPKGIRQ